MIQRIDHINLVADDLEAMIAFYRDLLGLRLGKRVTISGPWIEAVTRLPQVEAEVVFLEAPQGPGIELIQYHRPAGRRPAGLGDPNTKGLRHIAFRVAELNALVAAMQAAGVEFASEIQQVPSAQVDFALQHKRLIYCRDPEGNLLELCEFA